MCVNALNGLTSFLLERVAEIQDDIEGVNALNGLTSFLRPGVAVGTATSKCVSTP